MQQLPTVLFADARASLIGMGAAPYPAETASVRSHAPSASGDAIETCFSMWQLGNSLATSDAQGEQDAVGHDS